MLQFGVILTYWPDFLAGMLLTAELGLVSVSLGMRCSIL